MNCPACQNTLTTVTHYETQLDVCKSGCGGVWFDQLELKKFDEPFESPGDNLLDIDVDPNIKVDHNPKRHCPRCESQIMMRHFFSVKREIEVDQCPGCAGYWLDQGELVKIRDQFPSEEERNKAAVSCMEDIFSKEMANMRKESEEKRQKSKKIANLFRLILPSYWLPGDQEGGAY